MFLHRYSSSDNRRRYRWMFVARVLVGRSAVGKRDYVRPPPIKPDQPHGDVFDSCVNSLDRPTIFVGICHSIQLNVIVCRPVASWPEGG